MQNGLASAFSSVYPYCGDDTESKGLPALRASRGQSRVDGKGLLRQKLTRGTLFPQPFAYDSHHRRALPQLLSAVKQHALELRSCQKEGLSADELAEVQAAAHEALKQAVAQAKGSDESLRKMVDALHDDGPTKGQEVGAVLGKLDALAARMESMQAQLSHRVHVSPHAYPDCVLPQMGTACNHIWTQAQFTELGGKVDAQVDIDTYRWITV